MVGTVTPARVAGAIVGVALLVLAAITGSSPLGDSGRAIAVAYGLVIGLIGVLVLRATAPPSAKRRATAVLAAGFAAAVIAGVGWAAMEGDAGSGPPPVVAPR